MVKDLKPPLMQVAKSINVFTHNILIDFSSITFSPLPTRLLRCINLVLKYGVLPVQSLPRLVRRGIVELETHLW